MNNGNVTPMLFPYEPEAYWNQIQIIIWEEIDKVTTRQIPVPNVTKVGGLTYKPLLKMGGLPVLSGIQTDHL